MNQLQCLIPLAVAIAYAIWMSRWEIWEITMPEKKPTFFHPYYFVAGVLAIPTFIFYLQVVKPIICGLTVGCVLP
jgi:hypothetical protein